MSVFESGSNGVVGETENANHMDNAKHDHVDENDADCKLSMQEEARETLQEDRGRQPAYS